MYTYWQDEIISKIEYTIFVMVKFVIRALCIGIVLFVFIELLDGVSLAVPPQDFLLEFGKLLGLFLIVELILYPILRIITLPIRWLTLGLASIVLSIVLVYLVAYLYGPFIIESILYAGLLGFVFGIIRSITD